MIQHSFKQNIHCAHGMPALCQASWLGISSPGQEMDGLPTLPPTLRVPARPSQTTDDFAGRWG